MSDYKNLNRPPAMEVVFEVLFSDENNGNIEGLCVETPDFKERFPNRNELFLFEAKLGSQENSTSKSSLIGFSYDNGEELSQFRQDGFSYNKLGNYPGWDQFIKNAIDVYQHYPFQSENIKRCGLRFINVIEIEKYNGVPKDYFNVFLEADESASISDIDKYMFKYSCIDEKQDCQINVNFRLSDISKSLEAKFILDIDVLKTSVDSVQKIEDLVDIFTTMRNSKNRIFFSFLKKKVLEYYDEQ